MADGRYPGREQMQAIYGAYLKPILHRQLEQHPVWGSPAKIHALAGSMVQFYEQVQNSAVLLGMVQYSMVLYDAVGLLPWGKALEAVKDKNNKITWVRGY